MASRHLWVDDGLWHHISGVLPCHEEVDAPRMELWVDGVSVGVEAPWLEAARPPPPDESHGPHAATHIGPFRGELAQLSVWVAELGSDEWSRMPAVLRAIARNGPCPAGDGNHDENSESSRRACGFGCAGILSPTTRLHWHWPLNGSLQSSCGREGSDKSVSSSLSLLTLTVGPTSVDETPSCTAPSFVPISKEAHAEATQRIIDRDDAHHRDDNTTSSQNPPTKKPLTVVYYSSAREWDVYWQLYHNFTLDVLLRDVARTRNIVVVVDRFENECLSTSTIVSHAAPHDLPQMQRPVPLGQIENVP